MNQRPNEQEQYRFGSFNARQVFCQISASVGATCHASAMLVNRFARLSVNPPEAVPSRVAGSAVIASASADDEAFDRPTTDNDRRAGDIALKSRIAPLVPNRSDSARLSESRSGRSQKDALSSLRGGLIHRIFGTHRIYPLASHGG
jgi:hypothetical protein